MSEDVIVPGASYADWQAGYKLFKDSLVPFVCTREYPVGPGSELHQAMLGKVPSQLINANRLKSKDIPDVVSERYVYGFTGWVTRKTTAEEVKRWALEPLYGLGISGRYVFAIDIDIDSTLFADAVARTCRNFINTEEPVKYVVRRRANIGRRILLFRLAKEDYIEGEQFKKTIITTEQGKIEFLFQRCFIALIGTHVSSGERYEIEGGLPKSLEDFPELTKKQIQDLMGALYERYSISEDAKHYPVLEGENIVDRESVFKNEGDPVFEYLKNTAYFKSVSRDGSVNVHCPWEEEHSQGDSETTVKYYPPNGKEGRRGFKCLHASHTHSKTYQDFETAIGYTASLFPTEAIDTAAGKAVAFTAGTELKVSRAQLYYNDQVQIAGFYDKTEKGVVKPTRFNCELLFSTAERCGFIPHYDLFKQSVFLEIGEKRVQLDQDVLSELYRLCIKHGFNSSLPIAVIEESITAVARLKRNMIDSAKDYLESLTWDGECRVDHFLSKVFRLENNAYLKAVGRYLMSALAGRQLQPGVKADMIPVLIGNEGVRKSAFIKALSLIGEEGFSELNLAHKDSDLSRLCEGRVIVEVADLQGMSKRDSGELLAWVTTQVDSYIPKYKELKVERPRRTLVLATSNNKLFLNENTGRRRFLPIDLYHLIRNKKYVDTKYIEDNLQQLWAEGAQLFKEHGVLYRDAELTVLNEYSDFTVEDPLIQALEEAAIDEETGELKEELSFKSLSLQIYGTSVMQLRPAHVVKLQKALVSMGYIKDRVKKDSYFYTGRNDGN